MVRRRGDGEKKREVASGENKNFLQRIIQDK